MKNSLDGPFPRLLAGAGCIGLLAALLTLPAAAVPPDEIPGLPGAPPEQVGLSKERLHRINDAVQRYIDDGKLAGAVTLVARNGRVAHFEAQGLMDVESKKPMRKDTLFRMASTTKPVTAAAVLVLMEEGKLRLGDPVSRFIPEFKSMKVAVAKAGSQDIDLVPAEREITLRDLLTHTSGLGSGGAGAREMAKVMQPPKPTDTLADVIPRWAGVPLDFQPGSQWRYSGGAAFDILGRVVEIASGLTFDQFLRQRLFEPLGMKDTFFVVPEDRLERQATVYRSAPGKLEKLPVPAFFTRRNYFSGAGGLSSTAADFARFAQMLLNGGQLNGRRVLGPRTVELMGSNHVGTMFSGQLGRPDKGIGFGLGVEVVLDAVQAGWRRSNGSYGWDGAFGTIFWVDPKEQMIAVLMIQRPGRDIYRDFESAIRQAIID
jgi:CubicO group peptidase (beta-lactamase class C family)